VGEGGSGLMAGGVVASIAGGQQAGLEGGHREEVEEGMAELEAWEAEAS
jgi:hypothetical protein